MYSDVWITENCLKWLSFLQTFIVGCYLLMFLSALHSLEDSVDCRLALASLVLEDGKEDEAISLLAPPENLGTISLVYSFLLCQ